MKWLQTDCPECGFRVRAEVKHGLDGLECPSCHKAFVPHWRHSQGWFAVVAAFIIGGIAFVFWVYQWRVQKGVEAMGAKEMSNFVSGAVVQERTAQKMTEPSASGAWNLHHGKAVQTLKLTETGGVITGTITDDPAWGGKTFSLHGMRVAEEIELFYSVETIDNDSATLYKSDADYSLKGKIVGDKMEGTCKLLVVSSFKSGQMIPNSDETLWTAERQ